MIRPIGNLPFYLGGQPSFADGGETPAFRELLNESAQLPDVDPLKAVGFGALGMFGRHGPNTMPATDVTGDQGGAAQDSVPETIASTGFSVELQDLPAGGGEARNGADGAADASHAAITNRREVGTVKLGTVVPASAQPTLALGTIQGGDSTDVAGSGGSSSHSRSTPAAQNPAEPRLTLHVADTAAQVVVRAEGLSSAEIGELQNKIEDVLDGEELSLVAFTINGADKGDIIPTTGETYGSFGH